MDVGQPGDSDVAGVFTARPGGPSYSKRFLTLLLFNLRFSGTGSKTSRRR